MGNLPRHAYSAADVREFDRRAIEQHDIPGIELMQRAGMAAFEILQSRWPRCQHLMVFCGPGNNAGDGYVVATLARQAGMKVSVVTLAATRDLKGDAKLAAEQYAAEKGQVMGPGIVVPADVDVVVDALLGTGLKQALEGEYAIAVNAINASGRPVFALDIPSGLHADTGAPLGVTVKADATVTFVALKTGLITGEGPALTGDLYYSSLGIPDDVFEDAEPGLNLLVAEDFKNLLGARSPTAHKGDHGHALIVGGNLGMPGAARMAGEAALRTGAGLVSIATRMEHAVSLNMNCPELMVRGVTNGNELQKLSDEASVLAIGPGLGRDEWAKTLFTQAMKTPLPLVVDADGLNILAEQCSRRGNWVLTPHPGEAARLLDTDTKTVQQDRIGAVRELAEKFDAVVILKAAGSLVASSKNHSIACCTAGNPGMATAGMGDVLTGIVAGMMAQSIDAELAARFAVFVHGTAGDAAAGNHQRGLMATDLLPHVRKLVNAF